MRARLVLAALAVAVTAAAPLAAQGAKAGWNFRYDRANAPDSALTVAAMGGGFHFTTTGRGAAVAWRPNQTASGNYTAELDATASPGSGHMEGYGIIVGGQALDSANQTYLYFLVRPDGAFLIKHRAGTEVHNIQDWTPNAAIAKQEGSASAHNVLAIQARADSVLFMVNNTRVFALERSPGKVDGIVGVRINHGLSVHVARLDVRPSR